MIWFVSSLSDYSAGCVFAEPGIWRLKMCACWVLGGFRWWFWGAGWGLYFEVSIVTNTFGVEIDNTFL